VLHRAGRFHLWEAKGSELPRPEDAAALRNVRTDLGAKRVVEAAIVCRAPHAHPPGDGVSATSLPELVAGLVTSPG